MRVHVPCMQVGPIEVPIPAYQSEGAVGLDLCAAVEAPVILDPGARRLIPTGWAVAIPVGYEGQVRPRSGLALRHGVTVLNAPGTVDPDYRGELKVLLINHGDAPFTVDRGDRVAQLVLCPVAVADLGRVDTLDTTPRGQGGYGSTGV
ncbi:dUTP diphosphatase [Chondromyces apiculatus]|uniref:Deoxyuridine 5'-triphosphate nucleotidohydrolase n=1 Tax=Chondromyces apiculatus DSM 436 TaxID=1192034 RepID=A0A017SZ44_9BACT|nr:dUTP diphosphatase [Chondromyces apiculatus]EYF01536.1 Deoxyuridine 5'-triphosphate nucleotidohydrolase [Chondromyces apiculatus DSM 436]